MMEASETRDHVALEPGIREITVKTDALVVAHV